MKVRIDKVTYNGGDGKPHRYSIVRKVDDNKTMDLSGDFNSTQVTPGITAIYYSEKELRKYLSTKYSNWEITN